MRLLYGLTKELSPDAIALTIYLISCRAEPAQHSFGHRQRDLAFAGEHLLGAGGFEGRHIAKIDAAHEDIDARIDLSRTLNDLRAGVRTADDERAGVAKPGCHKRVRMSRVAIYGRDAV